MSWCCITLSREVPPASRLILSLLFWGTMGADLKTDCLMSSLEPTPRYKVLDELLWSSLSPFATFNRQLGPMEMSYFWRFLELGAEIAVSNTSQWMALMPPIDSEHASLVETMSLSTPTRVPIGVIKPAGVLPTTKHRKCADRLTELLR